MAPSEHDEQEEAPFIILGLGNPSEQYSGNRHNIGAQTVNLLAKRLHLRLGETLGPARVARGRLEDHPVVLARTRTFMNESGIPAAALLRRTGSPVDRLIVVYDELDLPLGTIRLRAKGSSGGHNGIASVIREVGSQDFPRLRIGIGRPYGPEERSRRPRAQYEEDVVRWVLSDFTTYEEATAQQARERAADCLECLLREGIQAAMNRYNG